MHTPSTSLLVAAESFLETAFRHEDKIQSWLIAALKTSNNPALVDGVIVTTNFADLYREDDEYHEAPSFDRDEYVHVLKRDTKKKSVTATDKMVTTFIDARRTFRYDVSFHCVLFDNGHVIRSIDVLDTDVHLSELDMESEELLTEWFYERIAEIEGHLSRMKTVRGHLRVVVDNS